MSFYTPINSTADFVRQAIKFVYDEVGLELKADKLNSAQGNCLLESIISNVNNRPEFEGQLKLWCPIQYYREYWVDEAKTCNEKSCSICWFFC